MKSKAKKSWYGHYNYLFVTTELYEKICENLDEYVPEYVGVVVPYDASWSAGIQVMKNPKKQTISKEQETMLKESMIRSMYYKMNKYKESSDTSVISKLRSELRKSEKERKKYFDEATTNRFVLERFERALRIYYGREINIQEIVEQIARRNIPLPSQMVLELTERGIDYNKRVEEIKKIEESD